MHLWVKIDISLAWNHSEIVPPETLRRVAINFYRRQLIATQQSVPCYTHPHCSLTSRQVACAWRRFSGCGPGSAYIPYSPCLFRICPGAALRHVAVLPMQRLGPCHPWSGRRTGSRRKKGYPGGFWKRVCANRCRKTPYLRPSRHMLSQIAATEPPPLELSLSEAAPLETPDKNVFKNSICTRF